MSHRKQCICFLAANDRHLRVISLHLNDAAGRFIAMAVIIATATAIAATKTTQLMRLIAHTH